MKEVNGIEIGAFCFVAIFLWRLNWNTITKGKIRYLQPMKQLSWL